MPYLNLLRLFNCQRCLWRAAAYDAKLSGSLKAYGSGAVVLRVALDESGNVTSVKIKQSPASGADEAGWLQ